MSSYFYKSPVAAGLGSFLTRNGVKLPIESVLAFYLYSWVQFCLTWLSSAQVEGSFHWVVPHASSSIRRTT